MSKRQYVGRYASRCEGVTLTAEMSIDETGYSLSWYNGPGQHWQLCSEDDGALREVTTGRSNRFLVEPEEVMSWQLSLRAEIIPVWQDEDKWGPVKTMQYIASRDKDEVTPQQGTR